MPNNTTAAYPGNNPGAPTGLEAVNGFAVSEYHTLAVTPTGELWSWGTSSDGQLGDPAISSRLAPGLVPNVPALREVTAGGRFSLAIALDGSAWAWGDNSSGQVGDPSYTGALAPMQVLPVGTLGCGRHVSPTSVIVGSGADNLTLTVSAGCSWTATSENDFVHVTAGASGASNGTVTLTLDANPDSEYRTGFVVVADELVAITQLGTSGESPSEEGDDDPVLILDDAELTVQLQELAETATTQDLELLPPGDRIGFNINTRRSRLTLVFSDVNGNPIGNHRIRLEVRQDAVAGGHAHGHETAPVATFPTQWCETGTTSSCQVSVDINEIGGRFWFAAQIVTIGSPSFGRLLKTNSFGEVGVNAGQQLPQMPPSADYKFIGMTDTHPDNHYGAESFIQKLQQLATSYHTQWPNLEVLCINDMSLIRGGRFDVNNDWTRPHSEHQDGRAADIRTQPGPRQSCASGIPVRTPEVRKWVQQELLTIFGHRDHCLEELGKPNEHYHFREVARPRGGFCKAY